NAAIAALGVQSVEAVEKRDDEGGAHDQERGENVGLLNQLPLALRIEGREVAHFLRQVNGADGETDQEDGGGGERRDVDGGVLPELARDRPVKGLWGGESRRRNSLRAEPGLKLGIRWRVEWRVHWLVHRPVP